MTEEMRATSLLGSHFTLADEADDSESVNVPLFPNAHPAHQQAVAAAAAERRARNYVYIDLDELEAREAELDELRQLHDSSLDDYRMDY